VPVNELTKSECCLNSLLPMPMPSLPGSLQVHVPLALPMAVIEKDQFLLLSHSRLGKLNH
jgi:hypothetical protein